MTDGGVITCFAYGQTGSGKTYTMQGLTNSLVNDLFVSSNERYGENGITYMISFFEIYGGRSYDLLNKRKKLVIREDGDNRVTPLPLQPLTFLKIKVVGLVQREAYSP